MSLWKSQRPAVFIDILQIVTRPLLGSLYMWIRQAIKQEDCQEADLMGTFWRQAVGCIQTLDSAHRRTYDCLCCGFSLAFSFSFQPLVSPTNLCLSVLNPQNHILGWEWVIK